MTQNQDIPAASPRKRIDFGSLSLSELFAQMSEGNPGAIMVMTEAEHVIAARCPGRDKDKLGIKYLLFELDDMNIRGLQIWKAWHYCAQDTRILVDAVLDNRDTNMVGRALIVNALNESCASGENLAVIGGADIFPETFRTLKP